MVKVWSDLVHKTAIAKTKGTFDAVNTNQTEINIQKTDAKSILGFLVNYVPTVVTDAEVYPSLIMRITSKALGISAQDVVLGLGSNDGDAVVPYNPVRTLFVPFKQPSFAKSLFNADLSFAVSPHATTTGGVDVVIAVVYSDSEPDSQFTMELMSQLHKRVEGGAFNADAGKAHGSAAAAVTLSTILIPTGVLELQGIFAGILPNGITASEPVSGFMEFQSSGIQDFSPQLWPLGVFLAPALGTVANSGHSIAENRYYPTRFPLSGAATTVNVSSTLLVAQSVAPDTLQALIYT